MNRRDFVINSSLFSLGLGLWPQLLLQGCKKDDENWNVNFSGKIIIVGAGAAGLMAGYFLQQHGIDFEILEASNSLGGRTKRDTSLADFPIDLGAEWIHTKPKIFGQLFEPNPPEGSVDVIPYTPQTISSYKNKNLRKLNVASWFYAEYKFKRSTWFGFLNDVVAPSFKSKIRFNSPVQSIQYDGNMVELNTPKNKYTANKVLITVPTKILQSGSIQFTPSLPASFNSALSNCYMPDGMKVFMRFSKRFYPDVISFREPNDNEIIYYDAAFKKDSPHHILGLFTIGKRAEELHKLATKGSIINDCLKELDEMFDGEASKHFQRGVVQDWSAEPYIQGSYTFFRSKQSDVQNQLKTPISGKLYFAGEALHSNASATVHGAALSGKERIKEMIQ